MSVNDWVNKNYKDIRFWILNTTKGQYRHLHEDLIQEVILAFVKDEKAQHLIDNNQARWYIVRIALNQFRSNSSGFYRDFRREMTGLNTDLDIEDTDDYDIEKEELIQGVLNQLDNMLKSNNNRVRYRAMIMMLYFSNGFNLSHVARLLNITKQAVKRNYLKGLQDLTQNLKKEDNIIEPTLSYKILHSNILKYGRAQKNL